MADTGRRRMGPAATGSGIPPSGARSPSRYLAQASPQQQQQQQQQQPLQRPYTRGGPLPRGGGPAPRTPPVNSNSKMGIKSGMTVEDLKRLTQQRMQQSTQAPTPPAVSQAADPRPATPTAASTPSTSATSSSATPTPTLNMAAVHAPQQPPTGGPVQSVPTPTPLVPKAGMSVQELKQLTSLRLASQNVPLHQSEITGLVSKAVLSNAAKSHYRESLRSSLTPSTTPRHTVMGGTTPSHRGRTHASSLDEYDPMAGRHSLPSRPMGMPSMRHGGGMSHDAEFMRSSDFGQSHNHHPSVNHMRYSYSGPDDFFDDSDSEVEADFMRPSLDLDEEGKFTTNDFHKLAFREDSFPPPPPLADDSSGRGGFVATSLPSWSPPPARAKKLEQPSHPVSFYSQQSSFFSQQQTKDDSNRDQNAIIAPPPGLSRRPSMTVPWQVAEAVLNTPQTTTGRKTVMLSPTNSGDGREPVTSNMFANPMKTTDRRNDHGLKSGAAEVAAEFGMLALSRQRSANGAPPPIPPNSSTPPPGPPPMLNASPPGSGAGPRRGSFGNAAEFFKFRRRSKSRLELARDVAASNAYMESGQFANYGATSAGPGSNGGGSMMPGIDETADMQENFSVVANDTSDDEDYTNAVSEGEASFVSFYNAAGVGKTRDGLSSLSIPPPPPPPLTDDEDDGASTTSSSRGLPMMSPNGVRLRKVAELARRGSLSNEDKTRVKDEIIQSSLGIGASNAARILTAKPSPNGAAAAAAAGERPGTTAPPPGFQRLGATPPRDTPKATAKKTISSGIVRNVSTGIAARSPPKSSGVLMLSPTTASRKALTPTPTAGTLEERLAAAAQRVADCVTKGDMVAFQEAMSELDKIRNEASEKMMRG